MSGLRHFFRAGCVVAVIALATVALGSCNLAKNQMVYDRAAEKDIQDYRDALAPQHMPDDAAATVPDFQSVISTPKDLKLPSPLVTVSVNQTVSLRDLMFELAEQAGVDIEMDPQIHGSIIFTAKERPFNDVIDRICAMSGLRYKFENDVLRIELDRPYLKNYKIDYMNVARKSSSGISTSITSSTASDSAKTEAGSSAKIDNTYDGDFWKDIEAGLKQVLAATDSYISLATLADPVAMPVDAPAPPPPPLPVAAGATAGAPAAASAPAQPPAAVVPPSLNVSMPSSSSEKLVPNPPATYSISKQTGIVSVFASERQHKLVQKFFDTLRRTSMTQILIEAKVLEVSLTDEFKLGIDWTAAKHNLTHLGFASVQLPSLPITGSTFTANLDFGHGWAPVINALSTFGTVRALSSPRVTVMNNQPAVVNVAENKVYFAIKATVTPATTTAGTSVAFDTTQKSVPECVLMNVVPTANEDTGEVILAVRPTVSHQVGSVDDPGVQLNCPTCPAHLSVVPEMQVQEIDSIVKMQSGQTLVMGGLMKDSNNAGHSGVPVLGDIPYVGAMFRDHDDSIVKSELVIFLRATIVPGSNVDDVDRKLYKQFSNDRRPSQL